MFLKIYIKEEDNIFRLEAKYNKIRNLYLYKIKEIYNEKIRIEKID